jgi:hypothetical protein
VATEITRARPRRAGHLWWRAILLPVKPVSIARTLRRAGRRSGAAGLVVIAVIAQSGVGVAASSNLTAASGAFTIAIPRGFRNETAKAQSPVKLELLVAGSTTSGFTVNIDAVRQHVGTASLEKVTQSLIGNLKRAYGAGRFSTIQHLTVDGAPAQAVSYFATFGTPHLVHGRQVYVVRDGWAYVVTDSALSGAQYRGSLSALAAFLASWRWRS